MKIPKVFPTLQEESALWRKGYDYIIGVDEVGRGAFAGPIVAAAVVFDKNCQEILNAEKQLNQINDSKLLSAHMRELLSPLIKKNCLRYTIEEVGVEVINKIGIGKANMLAMQTAIQKIIPADTTYNILNTKYFTLVDGFEIPNLPIKQKGIIKGDQKSISIAAASIIAKVYRDTLMTQLSLQHPQFGFEKHKGYGTQFHRDAISSYGLSPVHRTSFNLEPYL